MYIPIKHIFISTMFYITTVNCLRTYTKSHILKIREEVRDMFQHAYDSYLKYAYPYDELRPLSCDGIDTWGSYSLTLIDALDTLAIMGNYTEFQRVVDILTAKENFDANINVSVFETNIRIIGGLLSAHLLSHRAGVNLEPGWPCNGPLLRLAEDVAKRLIAAFDTESGMPYGTVNLRYGVPAGETTVTCTAGIGTFIVEFGTLSRLTGDPLYEEVALNALYAIYNHRSSIGLVGNHIDIATGRWTAQDAGIGAGVDSYYEYLVKGAILLQRPELMHMFNEGRKAIDKYLKKDDWHLWVSMSKGQVTLPVFQSLEAYWPGVLSLIGDTSAAMRSLHNYHRVWKQYGFTPEFYNIPQGEAGSNRESYPLRPELAESVMYLYRATGDPYLLDVGVDILTSIQHSARTPCGYATIKDVRDHRKEDRMESFFLAETTKYLYLLFDPDNFIHNTGQHGTIIETPNGECIIDTGGYIFNTEAHPVDPAALHCCSAVPSMDLYDLSKLTANKKLFKGDSIQIRRHKMHDNQKIEQIRRTAEETFQTEVLKGQVTPIDESVDVVKFVEPKKVEESSETVPSYYKTEVTDDSIMPDKIQTITGVASENNENDSSKDLFTDIEENYTLLPEFVNQFLTQTQNMRPKFDPQRMLERLRADNRYPHNTSWENTYQMLSCEAQPFLQKISLIGEFFDKYLNKFKVATRKNEDDDSRANDFNIENTASEELTLQAKGYKIIKRLGEGSYAKVYLSEFRRQSNPSGKSQLACKVIDTCKAPKDFAKKFLPRELDILVKINHPYIIHVHSIFMRKFKYFIFMRFAEQGDLLEYVTKHGAVSEPQARVWFRQLALAVQYLHDLDIAHRDLKCENALISQNFNMKLADFGFARFVTDLGGKAVFSETYCGSLSYAAPEVLHGTPYAPKVADIWSLGIMLYVMTNKAMPFDDNNPRKLYELQLGKKWKFRSKVIDTLSETLKKFVGILLEPDYHKRVKIDNIVICEWFAMDPRLVDLNEIEKSAKVQGAEGKKDRRSFKDMTASKGNKEDELKVLKEVSKTVYRLSDPMNASSIL